jgi:hypothetical protein
MADDETPPPRCFTLEEFDRDPEAIMECSRLAPVVVLNREGKPWFTLNPPWEPLTEPF